MAVGLLQFLIKLLVRSHFPSKSAAGIHGLFIKSMADCAAVTPPWHARPMT
jgi:hypothetical protein